MGSREFTPSVRLIRRAPPGTAAGAIDRIASATSVWLGLCWGLCLPLVVSLEPRQLARVWTVSIPLCVGAYTLTGRMLAARLERRGLSRAAAVERAGAVLTPGWIVGFSPLVLLWPARSLPVLLAMAALAVTLYRWIDRALPQAAARDRVAVERRLMVGSFLCGLVALFHIHVVHDAFQYYGYLVSVALDGDLALFDQIYLHNSDRFYNPFPQQSARFVGTAILQAPFFLAGHVAAALRHLAGNPIPPMGYGRPYGFAITLGSSLFGLAGMVATYRFVSALLSRRAAMIALLAVVFASPLVFFMYVWGGWAHPIAFALVAAFLFSWQRTRGGRSLWQWTSLGLLAGAIALVRPTAVLVLFFPLFEWIDAVCRRAPRRRTGSWVAGPLVAAAAALATFSPQLAVWKALSGRWIATPYREVGDFHDWLNPEFGGLLFAAGQHGLFVWTPLLLVAALGVGLVFRADRLLAFGATAMMLTTLYLYACWSIWWTGIGFSNRFFIELTPLFVLGLASIVQAVERRRAKECMVGVLACVVGLNLFLVGAYRANDIPQGIPDPYRVVDDPLTSADLAATALQITPGASAPAWLGWAADGFFTSRALRATAFGDLRIWPAWILLLLLAGIAATAVVRLGLPVSSPSRGRRIAWLLVPAVLTILALHGAIQTAASRTSPFERFHRLPIGGVTLQQPAADSWIYSDYNQPVRSVDLITHLIYGHGVEQGDTVASVTLYDQNGRTYERLLHAGVETAEASFPRTEHRDAIRHDLSSTDPVRARPNGLYSARDWESLSFRATIELPESVVLRKIRLRYLHAAGRLVVEDLFLRES